MQTLSKIEIRNQLLDMAKVVTDCLDEHDIPYTLAYGTLLGAVRHGGFIPWDDDFDIAIPAVYQRKAAVAIAKLDKYKVLSPWSKDYYDWVLRVSDVNTVTLLTEGTDTEYGYSMKSNNVGLCIDIYPFYSCPKKGFFRVVHEVSGSISRRFLKKAFQKKSSFLKRIGLLFLKIRSINHGGTIYPNNEEIEFASDFFKSAKAIKFEDTTFKAPFEPIEFLEKRYENWQKLPTKDEIEHAVHYEEVYWR